MAQRILICIAFIFVSCFLYGQDEYNDHQNSVSIAAKAAYEGEPVTATVVNDDNIMNMKVKELHLSITPTFKFVVPDASMYLGLKQMIGDTEVEAETEYNYILNRIRYLIKYTVDVYVPVGFSLYDNVDFQQVYFESKYIQRTKGLGISAESPLFFSGFKFGEEFKNESSYLARLGDGALPEEGLESIFNTWFDVKVKGEESGKEFDKFAMNISFEKAVPHAYSNYNFLFLNTKIASNTRIDEGDNLMMSASTGHLLEAQVVPLWKLYSIGGYDSLIGYPMNGFQGYFLMSGRVKFERHILESINREILWIRLDRLKGFVIADCGMAGNVYNIQDSNRYKTGTGLGLTFDFTFRKRTPIRATFAVGQAIDKKYSPVVYFIYELL